MRIGALATTAVRGLRQAGPLWRLGARRLLGRKSPFSMSLSLTHRCNFHCQFCALPGQVRAELSSAQWRQAIDALRAAGMGRASLIGGEPTLREDLGELIRHLKSRGVHTAINTNGWLVEERIDDLARLDLACISLDGPRALHDRNRRPGSFDRALRGIERLRRAGVAVVTMSVVSSPDPAPLEAMLELARDAHALAFFQLEHDPSADVMAPVAPQLTDQDIAAVARRLLELKARGLPVGNSSGLLARHLREGRRIRGTCASCFAGRYLGYVFSDGTVAPCLLTQRQVEPENGLRHGFPEAFMRLAPPRGPGCACMPIHEMNEVLSLDARAILNAMELAWGPNRDGIRRR